MMIVPFVWKDFFNIIIFGDVEFPKDFSDDAITYIRLILGIAGAVMAGWMLALIYLIKGPLKAGEVWAWKAITYSVVFWYVVDTAYSLYLGFPENALLNTGFVIAFAPPLIMTARWLKLVK